MHFLNVMGGGKTKVYIVIFGRKIKLGELKFKYEGFEKSPDMNHFRHLPILEEQMKDLKDHAITGVTKTLADLRAIPQADKRQ